MPVAEFKRGTGLLTVDEFARWLVWKGLRYEKKLVPYGVRFNISNKQKVNVYERTGRVMVYGADQAFRREVYVLAGMPLT